MSEERGGFEVKEVAADNVGVTVRFGEEDYAVAIGKFLVKKGLKTEQEAQKWAKRNTTRDLASIVQAMVLMTNELDGKGVKNDEGTTKERDDVGGTADYGDS